jgi:hypothetical protein
MANYDQPRDNNPEQANARRCNEICEAIHQLSLPRPLVLAQIEYQDALDAAPKVRDATLVMLDGRIIKALEAFENSLSEEDLARLKTIQQDPDISHEKFMAQLRRNLLSMAQAVFNKEVPEPHLQVRVQDASRELQDQIDLFLDSEEGQKLKNLVTEWWRLQGESKEPNEHVLKAITKGLATTTIDSRDVKDLLERQLTDE